MNGSTQNKTISKTNASFPGYLDFQKLRSEGIDYLGKVSGKIWTDYNVHDPGITTLEMLCYALLDLGYRSNLPIEDIFARDPDDKSKDNNFLTPAQILTCNPLTITDFRKLLIDIAGVKNAWLEVATDITLTELCRSRDTRFNANPNHEVESCIHYLNGLYHVYIDPEINIENEFRNSPQKKEEYIEKLAGKVRDALMSHRNLCEDFIDVKILCRQEMGVCAEIELKSGADPEAVFLKVVERLQDFFSPVPRFYTLQQLLEDKGRNIEEIFAGRPYNISESHGFVDTEEFEAITLRKEIHLSDIYTALFEVEEISRIESLQLRDCAGKELFSHDKWIFPLKKNHIPEFSIDCSGFVFTRDGTQLSTNFSKYTDLIKMGFRQNGKILYKSPSPYLDNEVPKGVYRPDIGDYFSIQNEFPRVYGIAEGGLPADVSDLRQSQALQLKAYLLFFDQLLANYLAQLKNIRSLFALSFAGKDPQHTYFVQQPASVPDLQSLLRFKLKEETTVTTGGKGSILARPVSGKHLQSRISLDKIKDSELDKDFPYYYFNSGNQSQTAILDLQNDLLTGGYEPVVIATKNECYFFYLFTSSCEFALISRNYYKCEQQAKTAATSLLYTGGFTENYRTFSRGNGQSWSFDIELNLSAYEKYLQLLAEDDDLFVSRRGQFLDHLLSRFAESFTDFALLNYGLMQGHELEKAEIQNKERFLSLYDDLSSNRGKAYDYKLNGWNNSNVSGTEKRFKALTGIGNLERHALCHFEVHKYDAEQMVVLKIADQEFFTVDEKFETREAGMQVAQALFNSLASAGNYEVTDYRLEERYGIRVRYADGKWASFHRRDYESEEAANKTIKLLHQLFAGAPGEEEEEDPADKIVIESRYRYEPYLKNYAGDIVAKFTDHAETEQQAIGDAIKRINDREKWEVTNEQRMPRQQLHYDHSKKFFVDLGSYDVVTARDIMDKPEMYSCEVFDHSHKFKFRFVKEFESSGDIEEEVLKLLSLLQDEANYDVQTDADNGTTRYFLTVIEGKEVVALYTVKQFGSGREAWNVRDQVLDMVKKHRYYVDANKTPDRWKFRYRLGFEYNDHYVFESEPDKYDDKSLAVSAAQKFSEAAAVLEVKERAGAIYLVAEKVKTLPALRLVHKESATPYNYQKIKGSLEKFLAVRKQINALQQNALPAAFESSVVRDKLSECGEYVYRLVDNDNMRAFSPVPPKSKITDRNIALAHRATLIQGANSGYDYLEIVAGRNVVFERNDPNTNRVWYHYQVKPLRRYYKPGDTEGKEIVLFVSITRYGSSEEAEQAFGDNYLSVLNYATNINNYGKEKVISDKGWPVYGENLCPDNDSIVFIPQDTLNYLGAYTGDAEKEMVKIAKSYPIRMIHKHSTVDIDEFREFNERFPCNRKEEFEGGGDNCLKEQASVVYYFALFNKQREEDDWQSVKYFTTATEAWQAFHYFKLLLHYSGNYFVDCDPCHESYKVFIREVLAESTERFSSEGEAWGSRGIEKFICISQTPEAFHARDEKENCCYNFYVACHETPLIHPCWYDTPSMADKAKDDLYRAFLKYGIPKLAYLLNETGTTYLVDGNGKKLAVIAGDSGWMRRAGKCSDPVLQLIHLILTAGICVDNERKLLVVPFEKGRYIDVTSVDPDETLLELRRRVLCLAYYFPVIKREEIVSGAVVEKFCIELKFGDYPYCDEAEITGVPCECDDDNKPQSSCHIAWKSKCCYDICEEAIRFYQDGIKPLLSNRRDYQAIYECDCGPYGIGLHHFPDINDCESGNYCSASTWKNLIVAFNPQCYSDAAMACRAVERSKQLINAEGLGLVEHILLRPHCVDGDCACDYHWKQCDDETNCAFEWKDNDDEDPCDKRPSVCFVPGYDRYSFIATVALPAWPERFRKKENRHLIETILRREAPAHVLLRILWLAPHDWCCFESYYKKWGWWLAEKKGCGEAFDVCSWLDFLFDRNYECLDKCDVCQPCGDERGAESPCKAAPVIVNDPFDPDEFLTRVNELYCWREIKCDAYEYLDCKGRRPDIVYREEPENNDTLTEQPVNIVAGKHEVHDTEITFRVPEENFINERFKRYKRGMDDLPKKVKEMPLTGKLRRFLDTGSPAPSKLNDLTAEAVELLTPGTRGKKATLNKKHAEEILKYAIYHYMDKVCFGGKDKSMLETLAPSFAKMREAGLNMMAIYKGWQPAEVKKYEPDLDVNEIQTLMTGSSK